jgi:precorrin-6B methylase 2
MAAVVPAAAAQQVLAADWPQWRGPERSNVSAETGLLRKWPKEGPPLLWKAEGLGEGTPSLAVAGGRIFTLGYRGDKEFATALSEKDGKQLWTTPVGPTVPGMRVMRWLSQRTPTVDNDRVYVFTAGGELICLDTASGKERWRKDYAKDFQAKRGPWGCCDFPLVDGDRLICTPGGGEATLVALNKVTGEVVWKCSVPGENRNTYSAVVVAEIGGIRQYVNQLDKGVVGVAATDGKLLWRYDRITPRSGNVHTALVSGDKVFCSCGGGSGCALIQFVPEEKGFKVQEIYAVKHPFDSWLGSSVLIGEHVYTCEGMDIELPTGKLVGRIGKLVPIGRGGRSAPSLPGRYTMTCAGRVLVHRKANNVLTLTEVTPQGTFVERGEFQAPHYSQDPTYSFPVVAGGRLYLRDQNVLLCYDIQEPKRKLRAPDAIFVPTPEDVVEKMLELANVRKGDVVYDLGCGDGRIVIAAAKRYGCQAVGYDIDEECVQLSLENVKKNQVEKLVRIEHEDIFQVDLSKVDVVMLYLLPSLNVKLIPQLEKLKPGSRIVSHAFDMKGIQPDQVIPFASVEDGVERNLYVWTTPLKKDKIKR